MRPSSPLALAGYFLLINLRCAVLAAEAGGLLESFESADGASAWTFSNGGEFPGARGSFQRVQAAAHAGQWGGRLSFDFTGGGNYVAAILRLRTSSDASTPRRDAVKAWLHRPEGNEVVLRYTDSADQTFQKPVECAAGRWVSVTVPLSGWTAHWGGPNDGQMRGSPKLLSWIIERGAQSEGSLLIDDLQWADAQEGVARISYPAFRFDASEGWRLRVDGNGGESRWEGGSWRADFSKGARSVSLEVPDRVLLGRVEKLRLRVRGSAKGHRVLLVLRTHFMTFQKELGEFEGGGDQELVTEGPPGAGWEWHGGENDGKIHGPLRLARITLLRGSDASACTLDPVGIDVDVSCPEEKRCVLLAESVRVGAGPAFVARIRALTETAVDGTLHWVLRDWEGVEVGRGQQAVAVPGKGAVVEVRLPIGASEGSGRRFLEAEVGLSIPGQEVPPVFAAWVTDLEGKGDATLAPESPFGMGLYLNRYGGDAAGLALMDRAAQMACAAGVKWSREDFSWGRIERERGKFDWTFHDNLVACARRNGITVYAIVGYWTGWTRPYTSEGIDDYVRFLRALVQRYRTQIRQWEIWNEPNIFFWDGPKDLYAELLTKSYAAIKEMDPEAEVLGLSTAGIDRKFISRMLELKAPFDILTIHPYRSHLKDREFIDELIQVSDQVKLPDGRRRPVWLTEMGWSTHTPHNVLRQDFAPNTLRVQAQLIARSYLCSIVSGVEPRTFWYDFRDDGEDPIYFEHQLGIIRHNFSPKPAYLAYATLTRALEGRRLAGAVTAPRGVLGFRFKPLTGDSGDTIALWSPEVDAQVELVVPASGATRINGVGERTELPVQDGKVNVLLRRGAPVYVQFR
jgi:hypothetical protein